jgi:hypothetical protein
VILRTYFWPARIAGSQGSSSIASSRTLLLIL